MADKQTVMVVGASRGLGLALAEEWLKRGARVIATVRGPAPALEALAARHPELEIETVDIAHANEVRALRQRLDGRRLDVLFINAGISLALEKTPATIDEQDFIDMMLVNALAPARVAEMLRDLVPTGGTIAAMSSGLGSIANAQDSWHLYSASKAALNMLMKKFAARHEAERYTLLVVAPGWVRTDMGGSGATLSVEESIPLVVDMVEANRGTPGLRYLDRFNQPLPW